jgi:predicted transcriptional regulator
MYRTTVEKRVVSAQVSKEQRSELERLAERGDRSLSAEIRRAIAQHLERQQVKT